MFFKTQHYTTKASSVKTHQSKPLRTSFCLFFRDSGENSRQSKPDSLLNNSRQQLFLLPFNREPLVNKNHLYREQITEGYKVRAIKQNHLKTSNENSQNIWSKDYEKVIALKTL